MNWIKKISKLLASLFVLASITFSFNCSRNYEAKQIISCSELLITNENVVAKVISYTTAQKLIYSFNQTKGNLSKLYWNSRIQKVSLANSLVFKIQNQTSLQFKSLLLNILINDIIQQKSY